MVDNLIVDLFSGLLRIAGSIRNNKWLIFAMFLITFGTLLFLELGYIFSVTLIFMLAAFFYKPVWGVYFLAIFIPSKFVLRQELMTPLQAAIIIPLVILFVIFSALSQRKAKEIVSTDKYLLLIFFASIVSCAGAVLLHGARVAVILDFFVWLQLIGFYLLGRFVINEENISKFVWLNLMVGNTIALVAILQTLFQRQEYSPWIDTFEKISSRATGLAGNPNALAGYLMMVILLGLVMFFKSEKSKQFVIILALSLPTVGLFLTYSRGAIISLIIGAAILLFQRKKGYLLVICAGILLIISFVFRQTIGARFTNIVSPKGIEYSQDSGRIWSINNVFFINRNHFLFGNGWGSYGGEYGYRPLSPTYLEGVQGGNVAVANTDNQWLQVYAQQGVIGLWLYALIVWQLLRAHKGNLFIGVLLSFLIWGVFVDSFQFYQASFYGFLILGILATKDNNNVLKCELT